MSPEEFELVVEKCVYPHYHKKLLEEARRARAEEERLTKLIENAEHGTAHAILTAIAALDDPIQNTDPPTGRGYMLQVYERERAVRLAVEAWKAAGYPGVKREVGKEGK
jgi:hypothetical protein